MPREPDGDGHLAARWQRDAAIVQRPIGRRGDVVEPGLVERDAHPVEQDLVAHWCTIGVWRASEVGVHH